MRIWVHYTYDHLAWDVHCLAADARSVVSPHLRVERDGTLLSLLKAAGADAETLLKVVRDIHKGRGTVTIDVDRRGREMLRIGVTA